MCELLIMLTFVSTFIIISSSSWAEGAGMVGTPVVIPAPVGHVQPKKKAFLPNSTDNTIEQRRLSTFDAQQRQSDEMLEQKLNICRC